MASVKANPMPDSLEMESDSIAAATTLTSHEQTPPPAYSPKHNGKELDVISLNSEKSQATVLDDLVDVDIDPAILASSIDSLLTILKSSIGSLSSLQDAEDVAVYDDTNTRVLGECRSLVDKVEQLEQIVVKLVHDQDASVPHVEGEVRPEELPIDPTVYKWTSDCVVAMLGLQADAEKLLEQYRKNENTASDTESWADTLVSEDGDEEAVEVVTLDRYLGILDQFNGQLEDFLPIIVA
jgi:hypothetical protein